eukprot:3658525-Amphidinium_carterae.1
MTLVRMAHAVKVNHPNNIDGFLLFASASVLVYGSIVTACGRCILFFCLFDSFVSHGKPSTVPEPPHQVPLPTTERNTTNHPATLGYIVSKEAWMALLAIRSWARGMWNAVTLDAGEPAKLGNQCASYIKQSTSMGETSER